MTPIGLDINIPELTQHALEYFPSLDDDRGTTRNYAQGLLTKHISEARKLRKHITDDEALTPRANLESEINTFDITSKPAIHVMGVAPQPTGR